MIMNVKWDKYQNESRLKFYRCPFPIIRIFLRHAVNCFLWIKLVFQFFFFVIVHSTQISSWTLSDVKKGYLSLISLYKQRIPRKTKPMIINKTNIYIFDMLDRLVTNTFLLIFQAIFNNTILMNLFLPHTGNI